MYNKNVDFNSGEVVIAVKKLAIIGGGAAGLCAAAEAHRASPDVHITIFEGMQKCAKKILATGNGRCNFTNQDLSPRHFYGDADFLDSVLNSKLSDTKAFFENAGVLSYTEDGRLYPRSQQASTIKDALLKVAQSPNTEIRTECYVNSVKPSKGGFTVNGEAFDAVILCGGGKAAAVHGSDGSCYKIAEGLNHTITKLSPALCGLVISDKDLNLLKGVRAECEAGLYCGGTLLGSECGEIQFTDKAISGIPVMNLSHLCESKKGLKIQLDLCTELTKTELFNHIKNGVNSSPDTELEAILNGIVNLKLGFAVMNRSGIKPQTKCSVIRDFDINQLVKQLKGFEVCIKSARGFDNAQVTKGGVSTREINPETMMSKKHSGLFICGELLDIHGDCGGYNLHLAFTTGRIAGNSAGLYLKRI